MATQMKPSHLSSNALSFVISRKLVHNFYALHSLNIVTKGYSLFDVPAVRLHVKSGHSRTENGRLMSASSPAIFEAELFGNALQLKQELSVQSKHLAEKL
jgi:hypothetical protein